MNDSNEKLDKTCNIWIKDCNTEHLNKMVKLEEPCIISKSHNIKRSINLTPFF